MVNIEITNVYFSVCSLEYFNKEYAFTSKNLFIFLAVKYVFLSVEKLVRLLRLCLLCAIYATKLISNNSHTTSLAIGPIICYLGMIRYTVKL